MKIIPRLAVAGVALAAAYLPLSPAGADCASPYCNPQVTTTVTGDTTTTTQSQTTTTENGDVLGNNEQKPDVQPASEEGAPSATAHEDSPSGELAFTGGDVLGMTVIAAGALGAGLILVRRSRAAKKSS